MRSLALIGTIAVWVCLPASSQADWTEDFESYALGSGLHGQGGWEGWLGDPTWDAYVSDVQAHGGDQSVEITADADLVHTYCGAGAGEWTYTVWQYIPTDFSGESYFIMLNTYEGSQNWSVQLRFDSALGVVESEFEGAQLPLITGEWVPITLGIDLDNDNLLILYGGLDVLTEKSWAEGVSGGGALNIAAVDLFANGATPVYYDDIRLEPACEGDVDNDGLVGLSDLATLLANYGTTGGACYNDGDLDFDRDVDLSDLAAMLANYGPC
jgi:hypothetical protein